MLRGSLTDAVFKPGTRNCKVLSGTLQSDPYTGQTITPPRRPMRFRLRGRHGVPRYTLSGQPVTKAVPETAAYP